MTSLEIASSSTFEVDVLARLDTGEDVACYTHGGILPLVYGELLESMT